MRSSLDDAVAPADSPSKPNGFRSAIVRAASLAGLLAGVVALFVLLLTLAFAIPAGPVAEHVRESVPVLESEGVYPRLFIDHAAFQLDNTTDSLMLDIALGEPGLGAFLSSMAMYYGVHVEADGAFDPIDVLRTSASGQREHREAYARYWHGYQVALRPALYFFALDDLRRLNMLVLGSLLLLLLTLAWKRVGPEASIAVACALVLGGFAIAPLSLQYSGMTYVAVLGMLAVILLGKTGSTSRGDLELFLVLGATTAFVDLLTTPLLTLGMPLGVALALRVRTVPAGGFRQDLVFAGRAAAAWGMGYVGAWVAKWVLGSVLLGGEVTGSAVRQARMWTGGDGAVAIAVEGLKVNVMNMLPWVQFDPALTGFARYLSIGSTGVLISIAVFVALVLLVTCRRPRNVVKRADVVLVLVTMPYLWLATLGPHSKLHHAYTYRVQAIAVFAIVYFFAASVDWSRLRLVVRQFQRNRD